MAADLNTDGPGRLLPKA